MTIWQVFSFDNTFTIRIDQLLYFENEILYFFVPIVNPHLTQNLHLSVALPAAISKKDITTEVTVSIAENVLHGRRWSNIEQLKPEQELDDFWKYQMEQFLDNCCIQKKNSKDTITNTNVLSDIVNTILGELVKIHDIPHIREEERIRFSAPLRFSNDRRNVNFMYAFLKHRGAITFTPTSHKNIPKLLKSIQKANPEPVPKPTQKLIKKQTVLKDKYDEGEKLGWAFTTKDEEISDERTRVTITATKGNKTKQESGVSKNFNEAHNLALKYLMITLRKWK